MWSTRPSTGKEERKVGNRKGSNVSECDYAFKLLDKRSRNEKKRTSLLSPPLFPCSHTLTGKGPTNNSHEGSEELVPRPLLGADDGGEGGDVVGELGLGHLVVLIVHHLGRKEREGGREGENGSKQTFPFYPRQLPSLPSLPSLTHL